MQQFAQSSPGKLDITVACLSGLFPESMQNINRFSMVCQINDPILTAFLYSNFPGTFSDSVHRLPIGWSKSTLNFIQFVANLVPDMNWKAPDRP